MWGRRQTATATASEQTPTATRHAALRDANALLRRASWEGMSEADRATLRQGLPAMAPTIATNADNAGAPAAQDMEGQIDLQDWVAALIKDRFQPEAAHLIRLWLDDAAPDTHLFVGGDIGLGRRSLVASLARSAMAQRPAPSEYCYLPVASAMDHAYLLALPRGQAEPFARAFDRAMRVITGGWSGDDNAPSPDAAARAALIAGAFAPLEKDSFSAAASYLKGLRAAFEALAQQQADLPVSYDNIPTAVVRPSTGTVLDEPPPPGAPIILGTPVRDKLDDLLLRANGGVLIMPASDLLLVDGAWPTLLTALTTHSLSYKTGWPLVPLSVRVALIGDGGAYNALNAAPGDFSRVFRYEAWCNSIVDWAPQQEAVYAALADGVVRRHALPPCDASAVARLAEEGARRSDGMNRFYLSANLLLLHDIVREAGAAALANKAQKTDGAAIEYALQRRRSIQSTNARRVRAAILAGQEITPTAGAAIGQINGLGIYEFHPPEGNFAVPTRISATVSPGRDEDLLDVERVAEQADSDHVRGELTIEGYLAYRYGSQRPLNLAARIRFEQEHGTTGGDSASGAILFTLLSALAQIPLPFSFAVTGAVGQYGELQPIGGVNTKIEGFWELCRQRRAQGEQAERGYGVVIPAVNQRDLMLRAEVADAIAREGWFAIWPASTVDEAIEVLMGIPAAEVHARVERRLQQFHEASAAMRGAR